MNKRNRLFLIPALAVVLTACGAVADSPDPSSGPTTPSPVATPSDSPEPSAAPATSDGTITIVNVGGAVDGPGASIADALAAALDDANLVNGVLLMDLDGKIWLCDSVTATTPVACDGTILEVLEYPTGGAEWDIENAEVTGLKESGGVLYFESSQLYGIVKP